MSTLVAFCDLFVVFVKMLRLLATAAVVVTGVSAHGSHGEKQEPLTGPHKSLWYNTLPGDGGTQVSTLSNSGRSGSIAMTSY